MMVEFGASVTSGMIKDRFLFLSGPVSYSHTTQVSLRWSHAYIANVEKCYSVCESFTRCPC